MEQQELTRKLLEIAKGSSGITKAERTCWLDGDECPYGKPEGQFSKRPTIFCKPGGCSKLGDNLEEIDDLLSEALRQKTEEELSKKVKKATTKMSSELRTLADRVESRRTGEVTGKVLKLAAELIETEENGLEDREIVLLEDLELD